MAKWKVAGHLAMAMREAERQANEKRLQEEQHLESIKNSTVLRSLKRNRDRSGQKANASEIHYKRWFQTLESVMKETKKDVVVASCPLYQKQDEQNKKTVLKYINTMDMHKAEVQKVYGAMEMVRIKVKEVDGEIQAVREKLKAVHTYKTYVRTTRPQNVEARAELAHHQLGLQVAENHRLVEKIENLEVQRDQVVLIHSQLKQELEELSKQLGGHIEEAQSTYEQRDMNRRSMQKLREHMNKSSAAHSNDMQSLQFKIDVLKRMEEFMMTKNKFRQDEGRERRREARKQISTLEREARMLAELLRRVQADLNENDVNVIVITFVQLQTENYMLFKNISHVRDTADRLQVEVDSVRANVEATTNGLQTKKEENAARKEELGEKIALCCQAAEKKEADVAEADKVISTYIAAVTKILENMHYSPTDITRLAGVQQCIEERNISTFLAEIEHYVNHYHRLSMMVENARWHRSRRMSLSSFMQQVPEPLPPREHPLPRIVVLPPQMPGEWNEHDDQEGASDELMGAYDSGRMPWPFDYKELWAQVEEELGPMSIDQLDNSQQVVQFGMGRDTDKKQLRTTA